MVRNIRIVAVDNMIDVAKELQAFRPINIERIPTEDKRFTPQVKIAFELYNKALNEIKDGYRDIAKSDLRKAVALCPEFSSAIMVLGILVFANGDRIGAVRVFNSVKDSKDREKAIAILDRLISESERPVGNSRNDYHEASKTIRKIADQSTDNNDRSDNRTARPMPSYRRASTYTADGQVKIDKTQQNTKANQTETPQSENGGNSSEVTVTTKALLVIVALLIAFAVIASALLVSMSTSDSSKDGALPTIKPSSSGTHDSDSGNKPSSTNGVNYPLY